MNLSPRRPIYNRRPENNLYRMFFWAILIITGLGIVYGVGRGTIKPVGEPIPTPTRVAESYTSEGDAHFTAGNITLAIAAYRQALKLAPENPALWAKLAQIQTYSSSLITTDEGRRAALTEALKSINQAKTLAPDDSTVAAIRAFVLDWNASPAISGEDAPALLIEAEQEAIRALQLDPTNTLALAYYAEILIDQQKITQAKQYMTQALVTGQDLVDVHRVYAYLLEVDGLYLQAIEEYNKAIEIAPNLTFLYMSAGVNYRTLAFKSTIKEQRLPLYDKSLEYFSKAAAINAQLGVEDPGPYISISKTYTQLGEFYAAGRNLQKALEFSPSDPEVYGQLGIVFQRSRNYEGAIPALRCAIKGCTAAESCKAAYGECGPTDTGAEVKGMALSPGSVAYYYTYVSMLAALSRPKANQCPEARDVIKEIRDSGLDSDPVVSAILQENENICDIVESGVTVSSLTATPAPTSSTPEAATPRETPTATPTYQP